jgi:hypothetical protein
MAREFTSSGIKRWLEDLSEEMGLKGEITEAVMKEAEKRMKKVRVKKGSMEATPRMPCPSCCRKHLGQAVALLQESLQGYPDHRWLAMGHIAEAEAEAMAFYPDISEALRQARKRMEAEPEWMPVLLPVISEISKRVKQTNARQSCDGSCIIGEDISRVDKIASKLVANLYRH